jgi:hypothetical protein
MTVESGFAGSDSATIGRTTLRLNTLAAALIMLVVSLFAAA